MVVDDSADVRLLVRTYVEHEDSGVAVVAEADGLPSALEALPGADPDVAVIDANMPITDGYEAAGTLRERHPGLRVVLLTAVVDEEVRERARQAGIEACLDKSEFARIAAVARELASR